MGFLNGLYCHSGFEIRQQYSKERWILFFQNLYNDEVHCYVDDIVIHHNTWEEHIGAIKRVLECCSHSGIFINLSKMKPSHGSIELLGHICGRSGISPSPKRVLAIQEAIPPSDKSTLRSFLGLANCVSRFVPHFSTIASPLYGL